jgi:hypothetical protein
MAALLMSQQRNSDFLAAYSPFLAEPGKAAETAFPFDPALVGNPVLCFKYAKQNTFSIKYNKNIEHVRALRGIYDIYHSFRQKYLQRYINEFTYRQNEGNVRIHTMDRIDTQQKKTAEKYITYQ